MSRRREECGRRAKFTSESEDPELVTIADALEDFLEKSRANADMDPATRQALDELSTAIAQPEGVDY